MSFVSSTIIWNELNINQAIRGYDFVHMTENCVIYTIDKSNYSRNSRHVYATYYLIYNRINGSIKILAVLTAHNFHDNIKKIIFPNGDIIFIEQYRFIVLKSCENFANVYVYNFRDKKTNYDLTANNLDSSPLSIDTLYNLNGSIRIMNDLLLTLSDANSIDNNHFYSGIKDLMNNLQVVSRESSPLYTCDSPSQIEQTVEQIIKTINTPSDEVVEGVSGDPFGSPFVSNFSYFNDLPPHLTLRRDSMQAHNNLDILKLLTHKTIHMPNKLLHIQQIDNSRFVIFYDKRNCYAYNTTLTEKHISAGVFDISSNYELNTYNLFDKDGTPFYRESTHKTCMFYHNHKIFYHCCGQNNYIGIYDCNTQSSIYVTLPIHRTGLYYISELLPIITGMNEFDGWFYYRFKESYPGIITYIYVFHIYSLETYLITNISNLDSRCIMNYICKQTGELHIINRDYTSGTNIKDTIKHIIVNGVWNSWIRRKYPILGWALPIAI